MVTSFADGSKISFEQAIVANATGFKVQIARHVARARIPRRRAEDRRDLRHRGAAQARRRDRLCGRHAADEGATAWPSIRTPSSGTISNLYKMGEGPLYSFFIPYHLVHFEVPNAIARVVPVPRPGSQPLAGPVVEVCAVAKRDLKAGEVLDDYGMYMTYGEAANVEEMSAGRYLPEGLVEGCRLMQDIAKDSVITYNDVVLPAGRLADRLRAEQYRKFRGETWLQDLLDSPGTGEPMMPGRRERVLT